MAVVTWKKAGGAVYSWCKVSFQLTMRTRQRFLTHHQEVIKVRIQVQGGVTEHSIVVQAIARLRVNPMRTRVSKVSRQICYCLFVPFMSLMYSNPMCDCRGEQKPKEIRYRDSKTQVDAILWRNIKTVTPWSSNPNYSNDSWRALIECAKIVQHIDAEVVIATFDEYMSRAETEPPWDVPERFGQMYLVLHMVFEIPKRSKSDIIFLPGIFWAPVDQKAKSRPATPIEFIRGQPKMIATFFGMEGGPWRLGQFYRAYRLKFKFRDLSKIKLD